MSDQARVGQYVSPTPAEHNVAVWLARNAGMTISWERLDGYQRNAWVEKAREVIRVVDGSRAASDQFEARHRAIQVVGREIGIQLALDPLAHRQGLTADAVGRIIDAYEETRSGASATQAPLSGPVGAKPEPTPRGQSDG